MNFKKNDLAQWFKQDSLYKALLDSRLEGVDGTAQRSIKTEAQRAV